MRKVQSAEDVMVNVAKLNLPSAWTNCCLDGVDAQNGLAGADAGCAQSEATTLLQTFIL